MSGQHDGALLSKKAIGILCYIENEQNFGGYRVEQDGLYVVPLDADTSRTLTPEERAAAEAWHPSGQHDKPALPLPCTLGQLRAFVERAGLSGCIDEESVDAVVDEYALDSGGGGDAPKVGAGATAVSTLPVGIPTGTIIERFKLTDAWADKLKHISRNPFLRAALMREGCRKLGKTPTTPHLWNPVRFAEILIKRDGRNSRAMEAIITHHFSNWQDVWHESMESDEDDEYAA